METGISIFSSNMDTGMDVFRSPYTETYISNVQYIISNYQHFIENEYEVWHDSP